MFQELTRRLRETAINKEKFLSDAAEDAGEHAEQRIAERIVHIIATHRLRHQWKVWSSVHVRHGKWKSEIDLVVTTHDDIFLLEIKNWSGTLNVQDDAVYQIRTHGKGIVRHGDLMAMMRKRETALRTAINNAHITCPPTHRVIVFDNPNLHISDEAIEYFEREAFSAGEWLTRFKEHAARQASQPTPMPSTMRKVHHVLDGYRTWDHVYMHGGKVLKGTVYGSAVGIWDADSHPVALVDRTRVSAFEVSAQRSYFKALFHPTNALQLCVYWQDDTQSQCEIPLDGRLWMHVVGEKQSREVALRHVVAVHLSET